MRVAEPALVIGDQAMTATTQRRQIAHLFVAEILISAMVDFERTLSAIIFIAKTAAKARCRQLGQAGGVLTPLATRDVLVVIHVPLQVRLQYVIKRERMQRFDDKKSTNYNPWLIFGKQTMRVWPTPRLIRAARGLVGIDQDTLASKADVSRQAVIKIEADESEKMDPRRLRILQSLQQVFEDEYGVEFFPASESSGEGVRFRK